MVINYDIKKIDKMLEDFYKATNISMNLLKADFSFVSGRIHRENNNYCEFIQNTAAGKKACRLSDIQLLEKCRETKKPQIHICHAGLIDAAAPILYNDIIIGYIIFGEMRSDTEFPELDDYLTSLGFKAGKMKRYYSEIPVFDTNKIQSVSSLAIMLTKHLLLENMLKPDFDEGIQRAVDYINENLSNELTIRSISENTNISKSVLYKKFHDFFNCTVSEYINIQRVDKSLELLIRTDLSVEEISQKAGFSSASYYGKTFKRLKGITPLKYRKRA